MKALLIFRFVLLLGLVAFVGYKLPGWNRLCREMAAKSDAENSVAVGQKWIGYIANIDGGYWKTGTVTRVTNGFVRYNITGGPYAGLDLDLDIKAFTTLHKLVEKP